VDTGSTAELLESPRGGLRRLQEAAGVSFEHLNRAAQYAADEIEAKRTALLPGDLAEDMSIVVFGSWAREELTEGSDDDWAVLVARDFATYEPAVVQAVALAQAHLGQEGKKPGAQDVFGVPFDANSLVENIGLDADTNRNFTRRMLLLLESRELCGSVHSACWDLILRRYLEIGIKNNRPPRFLLNDLVRYWRTICVDFEGKQKEGGGEDPKWVTRNAKLRTSRKLLFAGGLLPILLCHLCSAEAMGSFLTTWLKVPPLDRLATAFLHYGAVEEGVRTFTAYDRWIALMQDDAARSELKSLRAATRDASPLWQDIRAIGEALQRGLIVLLFETSLRPLAPQYTIF
jgi:hypothetical protein